MSAAWVTGGRVWSRVVERHLATALCHGASEEAAARAMHRCMRTWRGAMETLGPASGATGVWEHLVRPCAEALGWSPQRDTATAVGGVPMRAADAALGPVRQLIVAMPWGMRHDGLQRAATRLGASRGTRWVAVCNGQSWQWYDATRPYAHEHVAIDLAQASIDARVWQALWLLGQPVRSTRSARAPDMPWLERLVLASASEGSGAAAALRDGVSSVLATLARRAAGDHDAHVMLVFQWLFLLFAESRSLVPVWHPSYRRSYALSSLARESASARTPGMGVQESLVAIGRLGRDGAELGELAVRALGGPLFAGTLTGRRRSRRIPDAELGAMLAQLTHGGGSRGGAPIDFGELGVEHLGSLYERLMSPPAAAGAPALLRKRTGAFYTPRVLADMLVERTLEPLVRGASSTDILGLRILDPAMGSGALLASALRYLVAAVETAWVREGRGGPLDVAAHERESLPRCIAEQCLYGVDVNARAVDVARLSIWLLSMAPDRPLTWLEAHLRVGNSLIGTSPSTVLSRLPGRDRRPRRCADVQLTLFDLEQWHHEAAEIGPMMDALVTRPTESAATAGEKSRALASLRSRKVLAAWRARADAWCGAAMDADAPTSGAWRSVDEGLRDCDTNTGGAHVRELAARWQSAANDQRCLHWSLEFPEMFENGRHGFDAVIANPPWEMLRGDLGSGADRTAARHDIAPLLRFVRRSGLYREAGGHVNSYQLFLERMLQLVKPAGRVGCLLPGGMLVDQGAASLRRHVLDRASIDHLSIFDNREALFPIHRSVRIVAMTGTSGAPTEALLVDDGVPTKPGARPDISAGEPRLLTRALLRAGSGELEAVPWLRTGEELRVLEHLLSCPRLGGPQWHVRFGRELNATEDKALLRSGPVRDGGLGVVDGKHLQAFSVCLPEAPSWISEADACRALPGQRWRRWRLAYRDVSSATNMRSLIAALLPPACVSTHTLFCLREPLALPIQLYLCGMLNSLPADWFVRRYLAGHVTTRLIASLPVPKLPASHPLRRRVVRLATRLMRGPGHEATQGELHAVAATLYGLDAQSRAIVASDFPRLPDAVRERFLGEG